MKQESRAHLSARTHTGKRQNLDNHKAVLMRSAGGVINSADGSQNSLPRSRSLLGHCNPEWGTMAEQGSAKGLKFQSLLLSPAFVLAGIAVASLFGALFFIAIAVAEWLKTGEWISTNAAHIFPNLDEKISAVRWLGFRRI